jgi:hypothetical protein
MAGFFNPVCLKHQNNVITLLANYIGTYILNFFNYCAKVFG